ncbi:PD-(D/E)XK nuclease family protein [Brevibacillus fluminis]|uniref:PD-(D/E)XK nuclease family protein n=1 Tax=Brevibacillus fluminis TaxID=511487 RepID=UPI003F8C2D39
MTFNEKKSVTLLTEAVKKQQRVLFVGSHPLLIQQRQQELLQVTGGYIGIQWLTLHQLVERLMQQNGQGYVRIDQPLREDLIETVMLQLEGEGKLPLLSGSLRHAGMTKSVALWIEDLEKRSQEDWLPAFQKRTEPVLQELGLVYGGYDELIHNRDIPYKESEQLMYLAIEYLKELPNAIDMSADLVVVEGEFPAFPGVVRLMEAIARLPAQVVFISASSSALLPVSRGKAKCLIGMSSNDEIDQVGEAIIQQLEEGVSTNEIAIVTPNVAYLQKVHRELRKRGVRIRGQRSLSLLNLSLAKRLLAMLQLQKYNWQRKHLLTCTSLYATMMGMSDTEIAWGRAVIKESGVPAEFGRWLSLFKGRETRSRLRTMHLLENGEFHIAPPFEAYAQKWIRFLFWLRRRLQSVFLEETWETHLNGLLEMVDADETLARKHRGHSQQCTEYEAVRNALRTRREIALIYKDPKKGRLIKLDRFVKWFRERMTFLQLSMPLETKYDGLHVLLADQIYGAEFAYVYIVGLAEGIWPRSSSPHWIWQCLEQNGFLNGVKAPSVDELVEEDDRLFGWAVMSAQREAILSMPLRAERGRPAVPSSYIKEWSEESEFGQGTTRKSERDLPTGCKKISSKTKAVATPSFFDPAIPISVTGMNEYAKCPFSYFSYRVLAVREEVERQEKLLPTDIGSILHHVLRMLSGEKLKTVDELVHQAVIFLDEELHRYERTYGFRGSKWEGQRNSLRKKLQLFLRTENEQLVDKDGVVQMAEWGFGRVHAEKMDVCSCEEPLLFKQDQRELRLSGIIDRVDLSDKGFTIVDYKLSQSPTNREIEGGLDLQMALYLIAFESMGGVESSPLEGRFAVLKDPGKGGRITFSAKSEFEAYKARVTQHLFQLVDAMASGDVLPLPRHVAACKHCSLQAVCRRDEYAKREE